MLDSETKRRIDTARDILVGKVPDPKSQVEQITIALIYKFMDDMDTQAEELGGKRKFFVREFAQYGWAKLMAPSVSGDERIALYADGMVKMTQNPGVPALFRNIFKNAFLPYRDPETLKSFLKTINEFEYDHSERLGDAFEYLLSVLGSQGQAGQFRTPRHIIDFIVSILDPKKTETVLDPACGTAGFLISAYKHILRANSSEPSPSGRGQGEGASNGEAALHTSKIPLAKGDLLTPDERKKLADNFRGYDISPDMVRLSLVNMYLHGFTDPHVYEYDTLTSQDRWNELADVILANPPFMSPKGGIKPHNRFSVQSKRSEVLFVDYMAEHLAPGGRAGIIVPEGIIFQSQTAYKALRKMLVDEYLVAVVSLPAGVFNPYSGVKTSILILDKSLAKQSDTVGFFKVQNDGFGLGAQRRPIDENDLPQVLAEVNEYLRRLRAKEPVAAEDFTPTRELIVAKEKIAANGDYNLSGERYRDAGARGSAFPLRPFEEVCTLEYGESLPKEKRKDGPYPVVGSNGITGCHDTFIVEGPAIVVGRKGSAGEVVWIEQNCFPIDTTYYVKQANPAESDLRFLYRILKSLNLPELRGGAGIPGLNRSDVYSKFEIPLPPLEVQKEIVAEIEGYQRVIDGARAVLDHYRPHIPIQSDWPMVRLGDVCEYSGGTQPPKDTFISEPRDGYIRLLQIRDYKSDDWAVYIPTSERHKTCEPEDIMIGRYGPPVFQILKGKRGAYNVALIKCIPDLDRLDRMWLYYFLSSPSVQETVIALSGRVRQSGVRPDDLDELQIPLPPLEVQRSIVSEIEAERRLVEANRELIARMESNIAATLERIWGDEPKPQSPDVELAAALA
ncbi:MAG: N-6 DNA methylase [Pirellulales bacterium]